MRVGIFLGYGPQARLSNEGLGRYIGGLIKGFAEAGTPTTVVAPAWMKENLLQFFREVSIPEEAVQIKTTGREPIVWKAYKKLVLDKKTKAPRLLAFIQKYMHGMVIGFTKKTTQNEGLWLPIYGLFSVLLAIVSIPIAPILGLLFVARKLTAKIKKKTEHLTKEKLNANNDALFLEIFYEMTTTVVEQLVHIVNRDDTCDVWYVPSLFWPQVNKIKKTVVINAPDLVSSVYPAEFADVLGMQKATEDVKHTIEEGKYFITYCEYIRQTLLLRDYGKRASNVYAIPHVNNSSLPYVNVDNSRANILNTKRKYDIELCHQLLNEMVSSSCPQYYAEDICFEDVHYLFYASQLRPHKNVLTLLKAYEYLLRERHLPIKLVLTGWIVPQSDLPSSRYVYEHHLEHDVISFAGVSATTLSALYRCADLVVNPSMYEGGFAFTFGEGMSVGTPSILANVPFEMDVLKPAGLMDATFDPTDWKDLAEKIEYWLPRRDELYKLELPLYTQLAQRTPDVVANEYIKAFEYFRNMDLYEKQTTCL